MIISFRTINSNYSRPQTGPQSIKQPLPHGTALLRPQTPGKVPVRFASADLDLKIPVAVLPHTPEPGTRTVLRALHAYPVDMLDNLRAFNFKVILCPSLKSGYESEGVYYQPAELRNKMADTVFVKGLGGLNIIPVTPETEPYLENIVFHELSHGWDHAKSIRHDPLARKAYSEDVAQIYQDIRSGRFNTEERRFIEFMFPNPEQLFSDPAMLFDIEAAKSIQRKIDQGFNEAIADVNAWRYGKGVYGSGIPLFPEGRSGKPLILNRPNWLPTLFPNLSGYLERQRTSG